MKKLFLISTAVLALTVVRGQTICNMGVENGWGTWQAQTSTNNYNVSSTDSIIWSSPSFPTAPRFVINSGSGIVLCTPGINPSFPAVPLVAPNGFGNSSIQIGEDSTAGWTSEKLTHSLTVTLQDTNLVFAWSVLIQDNGHTPSQMPYAELCIKDQNGNSIPCGCFIYWIWQLPMWYQSQTSCNAYYTPWLTAGINLSSYIGQTLSVEISNVDCAYGGHWAQSFWDFQCASYSPKYCTGQQITLCSAYSPVINYSYQWYQNGNVIPNATGQCITVTPSSNDTFMAYVQQPSACNFYQMFTPTDTCLSSLNDFFNMQSIKILPNPFSTQTVLQSDNLLMNATLSVDNCFGQTVARIKNINGQTVTFSRDNLASGLYFLRLTENNKLLAVDKLVITDK